MMRSFSRPGRFSLTPLTSAELRILSHASQGAACDLARDVGAGVNCAPRLEMPATCHPNCAGLTPFPAPEFTQPSASSAAELIPALDQSVAKAKQLLGGMDDAALGSTWRLMVSFR